MSDLNSHITTEEHKNPHGFFPHMALWFTSVGGQKLYELFMAILRLTSLSVVAGEVLSYLFCRFFFWI